MNPALLIPYAMTFVGKPYIWGGEDFFTGFDCSGLVRTLLFATDQPIPYDTTAHGIYSHFKGNLEGRPAASLGALSFYGKDLASISHVGFMLDNRIMIHARGGDSTCTTVEAAKRKKAVVRLDAVDYRKDLVAIIKPPYKP